MTLDPMRVIRILNADYGKFEESVPQSPSQPLNEALIPYPRDARGRMTVDHEKVAALTEAAAGTPTTANFPDLLRQGVQFDVFSGYNETPTNYELWCDVVTSSKQKEEYIKDAAIGRLPRVPEGQPYPQGTFDLDSGVTIPNYKRGEIIPVTEEMQKFDMLGKVRDLANAMGRAMRLTRQLEALDVLTTTTNYTRTNAAGDNDETATGGGANTQNLAFSPTGLIAAYNILATMKDRKSGVKLNVQPNTLIVTPKLSFAAKQLIQSPDLMRVGGNTTNDVHGGGTMNPFFQMVDMIIVDPNLGQTYEWSLLERKRGIKFQVVDGPQVLVEGMGVNSHSYMQRDVINYRCRDWYGVGMKDDRFVFFSNTTTAPILN